MMSPFEYKSFISNTPLLNTELAKLVGKWLYTANLLKMPPT
jgi:hypothetical protein